MYRLLLLGTLLTLLLASCGAMKAVGNATKSTMSAVAKTTTGATKGTLNAVKNTASGASKGIASATGAVKNNIPGLRPGIDVVEVREEDMEEMVTGKDRALAYQEKKDAKEKKRSFWSYVTPSSYVEPVMPDLPDISDSEIDGSLLPPKPL